MQSFKQYLQEDTGPKCVGEFDVEFSGAIQSRDFKRSAYDIVHDIPVLGKRIQFARFESSWVSVRIPFITPEEYSNRAMLDEYLKVLGNSLISEVDDSRGRQLKINDDSALTRFTLLFDKMPLIPLDIDYVKIHSNMQESVSLEGCAQIFEKCKRVIIYPSAIKSNALGLLKLKGQVRFPITTKWSNIIASHLIDKDILACQEELIEAGFKQYAKF